MRSDRGRDRGRGSGGRGGAPDPDRDPDPGAHLAGDHAEHPAEHRAEDREEDQDQDRPGRPRPGEDVRPVGDRVELTPPGEVARAALNRAKAAAAARGFRPGQEPRRRTPLDPPRGSPGADARDPRLVSDTLAALVRDRGWTEDVSVGGVVGRWRDVVGDQVADHCEPETFEDGVLTVRTDSTSWATNLKLLVPQLLRRLADDVGEDVVREVKVLGPSGPGFKRGPRSVPGRGPRDTWG